MILGRVVATVTSTAKHPDLIGYRLLAVQPEGPDGADAGSPIVAVDEAQAGIGDRVLVMREGNGVRQILGGKPPVRSLIVAVVDAVDTTVDTTADGDALPAPPKATP